MPELPFKIPGVWAEDNSLRLAQNIPPVVVELKLGAIPISQRQYYVPCKAQIGIKKQPVRLLRYGILWPCQSPWNTPLLPVQKLGTKDFRPVQDLLAVNSETVTLHRVVPNPNTLLGLIPAEAKFFTCLHLKDTIFLHLPGPTKSTHFCLPMEKF
jgi:hypothetical protein